MKEYRKDFDAWSKVKKKIDSKDTLEEVKIGDIRWASLGVNVGGEIDGKGSQFLRPVLVLGIKGTTLALIVPLTSVRKYFPGYIPFDLNGTEGSLCVHQVKSISQKRLGSRIAHVMPPKLEEYKQELKSFYRL